MEINERNVKMLPPQSAGFNPVFLSGYTYQPQPGVINLVRPDDVEELLALGWGMYQNCLDPVPQSPPPPVTDTDRRRWAPKPQPGERTMRLLIPSDCRRLSLAFQGRHYSASAAGTVFDAPESIAWALVSNCAWMILGQVGTTEERPSAPLRGDRFIDTWVEAEVVFDGAAWRSPVTGEEV